MADFRCMTRDSDEWHYAWQVVHSTPFKTRRRGPVNSSDYWQYMGTVPNTEGQWTHQFRHRYHPATGQCERVQVPCRDPTSIQEHE